MHRRFSICALILMFGALAPPWAAAAERPPGHRAAELHASSTWSDLLSQGLEFLASLWRPAGIPGSRAVHRPGTTFLARPALVQAGGSPPQGQPDEGMSPDPNG
jgi:hypothetical protein